MPRRARPSHRVIPPDRKYGSVAVQQFISKVMQDGKRQTAESIVYGALDKAESTLRRPALAVFDPGLRHAPPLLPAQPRRVGGATYQVPVEIRPDRRNSLAMRWLIEAARKRPGRSMAEKLAGELLDALNNAGAAVRRKEETHKMA